ncbi:MAG: DUF305 domain-containing protein [Pseudomonadota bacterium]
MQQGQNGGMDKSMMRQHYVMLGLNILISLIIMYFLMFEMIWSGDHFYNNVNMFYMAVTMAMPMGVLMLLLMGSMYRDRKLNTLLYLGFIVLFALAFVGIRAQGLVGDRQFIRSMIPHHSSAIEMCNRASISDPRLKDICFKPNGIVDSQTREIAVMKAILASK